jgi:hypothetical protein
VLDPTATFPRCRTAALSDGICVESCYLDAAALSVSQPGTCAASQRCVACWLLGSSFGGC